MKIGVDLRVFQVGHQYRGIGEVAKQSLSRIFTYALADTSKPTFVFYMYDDPIDPKQFLDIPPELRYEEIRLGTRPSPDTVRSGQEKFATRWRAWFGGPIPHTNRSDVFLQFDYALGVPRHPRTVLVAHDLIPYIFWNEYFTSPWVHVRHKAARTTLRTVLNNNEFVRVMRRSHAHACRILCVSESTRKDLQHYLHVPKRKLRVVHLGVSIQASRTDDRATHKVSMPTKPFLLFAGGIDKRRRRVDDLIAAYNNLKAAGHDIQLVLVGENFQSPEAIPVETVRQAVLDSSYAKDILTLGYVDDKTKQDLFRRAIAFVFPTIYEGFGIPILESMLHECPVIAYRNSSIPEVGGDYALYANDWTEIQRRIVEVLDMSKTQRTAFVAAAKAHAETFTWDRTARAIYDELLA